MKELHITIHPDGTTTIDAQGYNGTGCQDASKPYEKDLGIIIGKRKIKPQMYSEGGTANVRGKNRVNNKS